MTFRRMKDYELMMNQMEELDRRPAGMKTCFLYKLQLYLLGKILRRWTT